MSRAPLKPANNTSLPFGSVAPVTQQPTAMDMMSTGSLVPSRPATAVGATTFKAGDPNLRADGKVPRIVTKVGRPAFEVSYKKGVRGSKGADANFMIAPSAFFPSDQCRFSFRWYVDPGFPWDPQAVKKAAGKILGFFIGSGDASGGNYSTTGASYRVTWSYNGGVAPYLYPQVREAHSYDSDGGNITWGELDQSAELRNVSAIAKGVHVFYPPGDRQNPSSWDMRLKEGQWNDIEMYIKLNTPGKQDGILEIKVNGVSKRLASVRYRHDASLITGIKIHSFFGGGTMEYAPPVDTKSWYADFAFSRS